MMAAQERAEARNKALEHMFGSLFVPGSDIWEDAEKLREAVGWTDKAVFVGSRTIPGAWTDASDLDVLCQVALGDEAETIRELKALGFELPSKDIEAHYKAIKTEFLSLRYVGKALNINVLVTSYPEFFSTFYAANVVCVALRLTNQDDRLAVFQSLLYDNLEHKFANESPIGFDDPREFYSAVNERIWINNPEANLF